MSIVVETLVKKLAEGEVSFKFRKTDGSVREARGTLNNNLIPEDKRSDIKTDGPSVTYWDMDRAGWRAFRKDSIVA